MLHACTQFTHSAYVNVHHTVSLASPSPEAIYIHCTSVDCYYSRLRHVCSKHQHHSTAQKKVIPPISPMGQTNDSGYSNSYIQYHLVHGASLLL